MDERGFFGVYVTADREIVINRQTSIEDLLFVIDRLASEVDAMRLERRRAAVSAKDDPR